MEPVVTEDSGTTGGPCMSPATAGWDGPRVCALAVTGPWVYWPSEKSVVIVVVAPLICLFLTDGTKLGAVNCGTESVNCAPGWRSMATFGELPGCCSAKGLSPWTSLASLLGS